MKLSLAASNEVNQIHSYTEHCVAILPRHQVEVVSLSNSFLLMPTTLIESWSIEHFSSLTESELDKLFEMDPEVILFATGSVQPTYLPHIVSSCSQRGIGAEFMSIGAACRTYNLLCSEERNALLAIVF